MRAAFALLVAVAGCRARAPTYHRDVAPLLAAHCAECHRAGGVAAVPPLDSYANVKMYAQPIRYAVQTRPMPPGDPRGVAQVTLFALDSDAAEADVAALGTDYPCFGTARARDGRLVASWTWPTPVLRLPAGVRLRAGRKLVAQIHYDVALAGGGYQAS